MFLVPTVVAPSPIAGVGVFTAVHIPAHTPIWEFTEGVDWRITAEELVVFPEPYQTRLRHYLYLDEDGLYVLCGDNARFMNHRAAANCTDTDARHTVTPRAIAAGEELTCNYLEFDVESRELGLPWDRG